MAVQLPGHDPVSPFLTMSEAMNTRSIKVAIATILFFLYQAVVFAGTIHVPGDYSTIQEAISAAQDNDTILVAPGTYMESIEFPNNQYGYDTVILLSEGGPDVTVIDGNLADPVVRFNYRQDSVIDGFTIRNSNGVSISCDESSPTIRNNIISNTTGGLVTIGISCNAEAPVIDSNTIFDNTNTGIYCKNANFATISNNTITGNGTSSGHAAIVYSGYVTITNNFIASNNGMGIYCSGNMTTGMIASNTITQNQYRGIQYCTSAYPTIMNNVISNNMDGGIHGGSGYGTPVIAYNTVDGNETDSSGAGLFVSGFISILGNRITNNRAHGDGGGISMVNNGVVANNVISGNVADYDANGSGDGGGIHCHAPDRIANNLILDNGAANGGGIACTGGWSDFLLSNNTLGGNEADDKGGALYLHNSAAVTVIDSILWENTPAGGFEIYLEHDDNSAPSLTISYSDVQGGSPAVYVGPNCTLDWDSGSMIASDPLFTSGSEGTHFLSQVASGQGIDSPCLDAGSDSASNIEAEPGTTLDTTTTRTDLVFDTGIVDMGYHHSGNIRPDEPLQPSGPGSGKAGEFYDFSTAADDPDGDQIYFKFDWGDGTDSGWLGPYDSGSSCTTSHRWDQAADPYEVKVMAKDVWEDESDWPQSWYVTITNEAPDTPPEPDGDQSGSPNVSYYYTASTTDPEGDQVRYRFDWGDGTFSDWSSLQPSGAAFTEDNSWPSTGRYDVKVIAKDEWGTESDWSPALEVTINGGPPVKPEPPSGPATGNLNAEYDFTAVTTDPDGDRLRYMFYWGDGTFSDWSDYVDSGTSCTMSHAWDEQNTFYLKVIAQDEWGADSEWSLEAEILITGNPPDTPLAPSGPQSGSLNVEYDYTASTIDPDGDRIRYMFDWGDGTYSDWSDYHASGATCTMSHAWDYPDSFDVKVMAQDEWGSESSWSPALPVEITSNPPADPQEPNGPSSGYSHAKYSYSTSTTDPDGDQVSYRFDWGDGTFSSWTALQNSGTTCTLDYSWDEGGTYLVSAKARDAWGEESDWSDSMTVVITFNQVPAKPDKPTGPESGEIMQVYSYSSQAVDPEGHQLFYWFDWGDGTNTGWQGPVASGAAFSADHSWDEEDSYIVKVRVKDDPNGDDNPSDGRVSLWSASLEVEISLRGPIYVDDDNILGPWLGTPEFPFQFIQDGIDYTVDGDTVLVMPGTYLENIDFSTKKITVESDQGPELTTIDGGQAGSVVVFGTNNNPAEMVLRGFRITNGYASRGGGIYCSDSSPMIDNNIICGNMASNRGGGIYCTNSNPEVINNIVAGNEVESGSGGGIYCQGDANGHFINILVVNNTATVHGGGICCNRASPHIHNCTFSGNISGDDGGGLGCSNSSNPWVHDTIFWGDSLPEIDVAPDSNIDITYSDIAGGWSGEGNIDADPLFASGPDDGDFYLSQTAAGQAGDSPCVDTGSGSAEGVHLYWGGDSISMEQLTTRTDLVSDAGVVDMGYHYPHDWALNVPEQYSTIQEAIDASWESDVILVAPGTYVENVVFQGKAIELRSDVDGDPTTNDIAPERTVIDGNQAGSVITMTVHHDHDKTVVGFTITNGNAQYGGGINCQTQDTFVAIRDNIITLNTAEFNGGGICYSGSAILLIEGNRIAGNSAELGGGLSCYNHQETTIVNNIVFNNTASQYGGGIEYESYSTFVIANNTVAGNSAQQQGGGIFCCDDASSSSITNTIVWDNAAPEGPGIYVENGDTTITYCDIQGGWTGTGNIDADPLFADALVGDFHLTYDSPCRNAGDSAAVTESEDFEGDPRIHDGAVDMGADEYHLHLYAIGDVVPGGPIVVKVIGTPGVTPVTLALGAGIQDPPQSTNYGLLYIAPPFNRFPLGTIPANGVIVVSTSVPGNWQSGETYPFQALAGPQSNPSSELTNLMILVAE